MATKMRKDLMVKELEDLLKILRTDAKEYAEGLNEDLEKEGKYTYRYTTTDTYPYRVGVAIATIKWILGEE